jgi:hypothetical protein
LRRRTVNVLLDNLDNDLIISDNAKNPSESAVTGNQYPKVTIKLSNFVLGKKALDRFPTSRQAEPGQLVGFRHHAGTSVRVNASLAPPERDAQRPELSALVVSALITSLVPLSRPGTSLSKCCAYVAPTDGRVHARAIERDPDRSASRVGARSHILTYFQAHCEGAGADVQSEDWAQVGYDRRLTHRQSLGQCGDQVLGAVGVGDVMHCERGGSFPDDLAHPVDHCRDRFVGRPNSLCQNKFTVINAEQRLQ